MASIIKENGKFRAYIYVAGERETETFASKRKAQSWAMEREGELRKLAKLRRTRNAIVDHSYTLGKLFKRYAREVSPKKKGARWELIRLEFYQKAFPTLCNIKLTKLEHEDLQDWIDQRLEKVLPSTVNRDLNLISHCLSKARKWRLMAHKPFENIERPQNPDHRRRLISAAEIEEICAALGYTKDVVPKQKRQLTALAWLFAIETCMRCGEITSLTETTIDLEKNIAHLPNTKNGSARDVPLSPAAINILKQLPKPAHANAPIFQLSSQTVDALFRKYRKKTTVKDLTFHDSRHEGITRLVDTGSYNVFEVAAVTGHKNINELLTYYNKSATQIAKEMAKSAPKKAGKSPQEALTLGNLTEIIGLKELVKEVLLEQSKLSA